MAFPKPPKGSALLERRQAHARRKARESVAMRAARHRDGYICRWPGCTYGRLKIPIDVAHLVHRGMGGNPRGHRTRREAMITLCRIHHAQLDAADVKITPGPLGTDGPCAFYRRLDASRGLMSAWQWVAMEPITRTRTS